jgi:ribonuclease VapC
MVVDTSAILAILEDEPEGRPLLELLFGQTELRMSMVSVVETAIAALGRGTIGRARALELIDALSIEPVPVDAMQMGFAIEAYAQWGKGYHAAKLNFGDCFSYALAKALDEPLLFKGGDFALTDIAPAIAP